MQSVLLLLSNFFYSKPIELEKILKHFENINEVLDASGDIFFKLGIKGKSLEDFLENRSKVFKYNLKDPNIKIITILDKNYPKELKNIYDPPPILFYKGDLDILNQQSIAVIGSRKMTDYGRRVGEDIIPKLAKDFVIVSGLAYGIDGLAHKITVNNNGKTVAVLGSGLNKESIYPKENLKLSENIFNSGGLLLSEVPPGGEPLAFHFPMRNRIISALVAGILVIEGGKKSGTLITAKLGIDYGKDIFAIPNNIYNVNSLGVNYLIKCGAIAVTCAEDILEFYGKNIKNKIKEYIPKTEKEKNILENLKNREMHIDELSKFTGIQIIDLVTVLAELEMSGIIKSYGQKYIII